MKKRLALLMTIFLVPAFVWAGEVEDFGDQLSNFYKAPSLEKFEVFQKQAQKLESEIFKKKGGVGLLVSVMIAKISKKYSWPITVDGKAGKMAKDIVLGKSDLAKYVENDKLVSPAKLDIWWVSYFATGETQYLDKILVYAGEESPQGELGKTMIVGAATWSFKSNCRQHNTIKEYAKKCLKMEQYKKKKKYLDECINQ